MENFSLNPLLYSVCDCCLTTSEQFFNTMMRISYIRWDDDDDLFVLDQQVLLDFYCASSLKQQPADRHVAPLGHIILILKPSTCSYSPMLRTEKQQN
jgi:predicted alpha/beta hydrolase